MRQVIRGFLERAPVKGASDDPLYFLLMPNGQQHSTNLRVLTLGALGVVFGDIGTSPLYTLKECLHSAEGHRPAEADLYGVLSLIFWALTMVVTVIIAGV